MKGILIKDFLYLREMKRLLAVFGAIFLFLLFASKSDGSGGGVTSGANFFAAFTVMMTLILILSLFSYDNASKWDLYAGSLPVNRSLAVAGKYLMTLILAAGFTAFFAGVSFLVLGGLTWNDFWTYYSNFGAAILLLSVLIPLMYKFGVQKASLIFMIIFMIIFLLIIMVSMLLKNIIRLTMTDADMLFWLRLSPAFLLIFFFGSFLISCAVYRRKEF